MVKRNDVEGEAGYLLWEVALSLPMISLLLLTMAALLLGIAHSYLQSLAENELQQEIQLAFQRVINDCQQGAYLTKYTYFTDSLVVKDSEGKTIASYHINKPRYTRKLVYYQDDSPMTGDHTLAEVDIESFGWQEIKPGLYRIWLQGYSRYALHKHYKLVTEVFLPGKKMP